MSDERNATAVGASATGVTRASSGVAWRIGTPMTPVGYYPAYGPLPAVDEVREQTGAWDSPGQTRQLMLSDGGSVVETLVRVDPPADGASGTFVYELSRFQKLFGRIVSGARAVWVYTPDSRGTRIDWTYTYVARPGWGLVLRGIIRFFWAPYMRRVLPGIIAEIDRHA